MAKVFGIGLGKSGTTTLGRCLKVLRFNHFEPAELPRRELVSDVRLRDDFSRIKEVVERFDSFEDIPWPCVYKRLDQDYPNSKFILTVRKDAQ